ncbi:hypothetical protein KFU94_49765 [Chloroflexi bacterium TSY]|nr:hypothetical protein [Chloroflexi bacterium TSY]
MMRQALVVIHGMGEQKPMGTIRPFAEAILGSRGKKGEFWSKPDKMSELFELRRLQAKGKSNIHFYEYYWAYNLEGTSVWDVLWWAVDLFKRNGKDVPPASKSLWLLTRFLVGLVIVGIVFGFVDGVLGWLNAQPTFGAVWITITLIGFALQYFLISYLGDAARYLSPIPRNIKLRQKIRTEGINLLRSLHGSGDYDRIILVGHSLGSIIAYDIITHLWDEYNAQLSGLEEKAEVQRLVREAMANQKTPQPVVRNEISVCGEELIDDPDNDQKREDFREKQHEAWKELRFFGNPWLISDFVTMGSPLTHGLLLLASSTADFESRKDQRELITCPPQRDQKGYSYSSPKSYEVGEKKKYTPLILHHAAAFAVTRWTNLYFPAKLGLFGDFVGGPLSKDFGEGIKDVPVSTIKWYGLANWTIASHNCYWLVTDDVNNDDQMNQLAVIALRDAISLEN